MVGQYAQSNADTWDAAITITQSNFADLTVGQSINDSAEITLLTAKAIFRATAKK